MSRKIIFSQVRFFLLLLVLLGVAGINVLYAQAGVTVYLRNISGYPVDFCIAATATADNNWSTLSNGNKTQFPITFGYYFFYRYTGRSQIRSVRVGPYAYVAAWWKFTPGGNDPGVSTADGGITLLDGPTVPLLEGDPEMSDPNVPLQPGGGQPPRPPVEPLTPPRPPEVIVGGQIGVVWGNMGGAQGPLGMPTTNELQATPSFLGTRGVFRNFSGGQIIWFASGSFTGHAFAVYGAIGAMYLYMGGTASRLGFPLNNEMNIAPSPAGTSGRWQPFEGGLMVWHGNGRFTGRAYSVEGAIATLYQGYGGTASWLGMPISFEYDWNGGRRSDFEGGYIFWTSQAGAKAFYYQNP